MSATRWVGLRLNVFEFAAASIVVGSFGFTWIMLLPCIVFPYSVALPLGALLVVALGVLLWLRGRWRGFEPLSRRMLIAWSVIAALSLLFWATLSWTHDLNPVNGTLMSAGSTWADFGLHANIATHQAYADRLPGNLPIASGTNMTYPFLIDFLSALFLKGGWSLHLALAIPGTLLCWSITQLILGFGRRLFGSFAGAVVGCVLTLAGGSFIGITLAWHSYSDSGKSLTKWLGNLPDGFAGSWEHNAPFFNPVADLLLPQRAFLFGLGIWLVIAILWHRSFVGDAGMPVPLGDLDGSGSAAGSAIDPGSRSAKSQTSRPARAGTKAAARSSVKAPVVVTQPAEVPLDATGRRALFSGAVLFGLMPMTHAHSFICAAVLFAGLFVWVVIHRRAEMKTWLIAAAVAIVIALPQLAWQQFAVENGTGGHVTHGWVRVAGDPILSFEWRNFGFLLIVLLVIIALLFRPGWRLYRPWYIPFLILFVLAQLYSVQPLAYDNLKLFFYVFMLAMLFLGALIMRIKLPTSWATGGLRTVAVVVAFAVIGTGGALTIVREYQLKYQFASADDLALADWVKANTSINAIFAGTPSTGEAAGTVAGRNLLQAYPGWLFNYNLDTTGRDAALAALMRGDLTDPNVAKYKPDYLVVGSNEAPGTTDPAGLAKLNKVYSNDSWTVYKLR
ncbi:hypothetical protein [Jatrophihabitans sp. GAS493]|uniref:hypothetical protein n=1 Tax=Jatrophihabitans sp. GAS493 TaxID=1907575 RepID=UPI0012FDA83B|nr:hypothetical protein [Jatrophihabitans sp. GAS493]